MKLFWKLSLKTMRFLFSKVQVERVPFLIFTVNTNKKNSTDMTNLFIFSIIFYKKKKIAFSSFLSLNISEFFVCRVEFVHFAFMFKLYIDPFCIIFCWLTKILKWKTRLYEQHRINYFVIFGSCNFSWLSLINKTKKRRK